MSETKLMIWEPKVITQGMIWEYNDMGMIWEYNDLFENMVKRFVTKH